MEEGYRNIALTKKVTILGHGKYIIKINWDQGSWQLEGVDILQINKPIYCGKMTNKRDLKKSS